MVAKSPPGRFHPELFAFLRELEKNNNRDWFRANKGRYEEHVKEAALDFISDFGPHLRRISRHFDADPRPSGGSLFRIYRDVRFSKDKSPYKTNCAMQFRHRQRRDVHAPGYYLSLAPEAVYAGAGIYRPDGPTLKRIRDAIASRPARWRRAVASAPFSDRFELGGESLKRAPRGYPPEHPLVEDLKRKDFYGWLQLTPEEACAPDFIEHYAAICRDATALMRFLCRAVDAPF